MHISHLVRCSRLAALLVFAGLMTGCSGPIKVDLGHSSAPSVQTPLPSVPLSRYTGTWQGNWTAQMGGAQSGSVTMQFTVDGKFTGQYTNTVTQTTGTLAGTLVPITGQNVLTNGYEMTNTPVGTHQLSLSGTFVLNSQGMFPAAFAIPPLPADTQDADVIATATMSKQ